LILKGRVAGQLAITRALGDLELKSEVFAVFIKGSLKYSRLSRVLGEWENILLGDRQ